MHTLTHPHTRTRSHWGQCIPCYHWCEPVDVEPSGSCKIIYFREKTPFLGYHRVTVSFSYLSCNSLTIFQPEGENLSKLRGLRDKSLYDSYPDRIALAQHFFHHIKTEIKMLTFDFLTKIVVGSNHYIFIVMMFLSTLSPSRRALPRNNFPLSLSKWISAFMIVIVIVTIMRNHIFSSLACLFIMQSFEELLPQHLVRVMEDKLREKTKSNLG